MTKNTCIGRSQQRDILKLAMPILFIQISLVLVPLTDIVLSANYSVKLLAALGLGASIYVTIYVGLMGIIQIFNALLSKSYGANDVKMIKTLHGQAYVVIVILSILGIWLINKQSIWKFILSQEGDLDNLQRLTLAYLKQISLAFPFALFIRFGTTYLNTMGRVYTTLVAAVFYLLVKAPLSFMFLYCFSYDNMSAIKNCANATLVANILTTLLLIHLMLIRKDLAIYRPTWPKGILSLKTLKRIFFLGLPNGLVYSIQSTSFYAVSFFILPLGIYQIAAHQISSNIVSLLYMGPLSLGSATTILVARQKGLENYKEAHRIAICSLQIAFLVGVLLSVVFMLAKEQVFHLFGSDETLKQLCLSLFSIVAIFQIFDWLSTVQYSILKGLEQTFWPMTIYLACTWGIGIVGGYMINFGMNSYFDVPPSVEIFWITCTASLLLCNVILYIYCHFYMKSRLKGQTC